MYETIIENAKALIFDLDGTIVDSMPLHFQAWTETAKHFNFPYTEELFYKYAGMPATRITEEINKLNNLKLDAKEISRYKGERFLKLLKNLNRIEPITKIIEQNYGKKKIAIATGGRRVVAKKELEMTDLYKYFDAFVYAEDVTNHKPHPETFLKVAMLLGVEPKNCVVFEDGDLGLQGAIDAGMEIVDVRKILC